MADQLRREAELSAATATKHERSANLLLYVSRMRLAYQWLEQGDVERVAELLEPYDSGRSLAHLRGFEWYHLRRKIHGERLTLSGHAGEVYAVAFSPNGRVLASGAQDGAIKFWDPTDGRELARISAHSNCVNALAFSPDGALLASGSCDRMIKLWNATTHELVGTLEGHPDNVQCVAFSPADGNLLASCGNDAVVRIWDVATQEVVRTLDTKRQAVVSLAWRFDGKALFLAAQDGRVGKPAAFEWDLAKNEPVGTYPYGAWSVAGSSHSSEFCLGSADGCIRKFTNRAPQPLGVRTHLGHIYSLAISPDGKRLASGGADRTIRIWDTVRNVHMDTFTGHVERVQSLALSPDGLALASGSFDGTVKLWDIEAGDREVLTTELFFGAMRPEEWYRSLLIFGIWQCCIGPIRSESSMSRAVPRFRT